MVGTICFARIYFTDNKNFKLRPILIIKKNSFNDFIYIPFTTNSKNRYSFKFSNSFLEFGEFKRESYLILDKTCTIEEKLLDKKIAKVKNDIFENILDEYCKVLRV